MRRQKLVRPTMHEESITHSLPRERERGEGTALHWLLGRLFFLREKARNPVCVGRRAVRRPRRSLSLSGDDDDDDRDWLQFPEGTGYGPCG